MNTEFPESSGIVRLTPNVLRIRDNMPFTTHNELQHNRPYFLVFYAKWCGFCKQLSPIMAALSQKYVSMSRHKPVAAIDCEQHPLDSSFRTIVEGYPTIFSIKGNSCKRYRGDRSVEALDSHLNERAAEPESQLLHAIPEEVVSSKSRSVSSKSRSVSTNVPKRVRKTRKTKAKSQLGGRRHIFNKIRSFRR